MKCNYLRFENRISVDDHTSSADPKTEKLIYKKLLYTFKDKDSITSVRRHNLLDQSIVYTCSTKNGSLVRTNLRNYLPPATYSGYYGIIKKAF
ncbi:MAG: hypothetical protein ABI415_07725 [Flavitalea sp.]